MSTIKFILKDLGVMKLWSVWTRRCIVSTVVKRCMRDRGFREVILRFKHTILRQRRTLMLAATAACKSHSDVPSCDEGISDNEMQALLSDLENVQSLAKLTLYCTSCGKRLVIDRKQTGVRYCVCKDPKPLGDSLEGWVPYMETEDVIIWRKEYKPGKGLYAYKVYGRYPEVQASDFAAVQIDGAYRRVWDAAVAALSVVETNARGVPGQAVLHWEVLWPRLFANRDYVYIRRHKEYDIKTKSPAPIIEDKPIYSSSDNVHSKAKRKSLESYAREGDKQISNKVYIIISKSCEHPDVPETRNAIRVSEYWSHMVVKTMDGTEKPGMEFVLTYYDEPAVGGMPGGVTAWVSSRAAPQYLDQMRRAATDYRAWAKDRTTQELPDFIPFGPDKVQNELALQIQEQDMESSKLGPELENGAATRDQSSQTDEFLLQNYTPAKKDVPSDNGNSTGSNKDIEQKSGEGEIKSEVFDDAEKNTELNEEGSKNDGGDEKKGGGGKVKETGDKEPVKGDEKTSSGDEKESNSTSEEEKEESDKTPVEEENNGGWWRYLYPFYYFV
ncbi:uncharacterized protein LOC123878613 [Maniola jurtina]|uniref:uncharacterized protein LOC123878613 n=1 Tax=Maniola jurtina TaxID=191418 RepID=UPI001E68650B|nr:uncharacterized protein LOC123878613 [Maniola jurtina]